MKVAVPSADEQLVAEALRSAASNRRRVVDGAVGDLAEQHAAGVDIAAAAVRLVLLAAEAARLDAYAYTLTVPTTAPAPVTAPPAPTAAETEFDRLAAEHIETPMCLHEAWETDDTGEPARCADCREPLPADWTGPR